MGAAAQDEQEHERGDGKNMAMMEVLADLDDMIEKMVLLDGSMTAMAAAQANGPPPKGGAVHSRMEGAGDFVGARSVAPIGMPPGLASVAMSLDAEVLRRTTLAYVTEPVV